MAKKLILAEKPSVAREIARVLGSRQNSNGYIEGPEYVVTWALGHLVTLAEPEAYGNQYKEWNLESLPMLPAKMDLVVIPKTAKQFHTVKSLMYRKDISELIIATDSGREGELVARWIMQKAACSKPAKRLWISSQTDKAVKDGFRALKPASQYDNLFHSASCRAQADWFVGLNVTRALTCKFNAQLSAGRVQTPTLSMIIEREEEIRAFRPKDYVRIQASLPGFTVMWQDKKSGQSRIFDPEAADKLIAKTNGKPLTVLSVSKYAKSELPPLAYDLTELQRDANRLYSYSAKKTLSVLQELYEVYKLVTYPRTDSRHVTRDIVATLPDRLKAINKGSYAKAASALLRGGIRTNARFVDDAKVTDHHAIIPTEQPLNMAVLDNDQKRIFDLIAKRFLAVLSKPFEYEETVVLADISGEKFTAKGRIVKAEGWREIYSSGSSGAGGGSGSDGALGSRSAASGRVGAGSGTSGGIGSAHMLYSGDTGDDDDEDDEGSSTRSGSGSGRGLQNLPNLQNGSKFKVLSLTKLPGKTKPPARYNEATLLTAMEHPGKFIEDRELRQVIESASGIGTPATRAEIIEKLFDSFYVERGGRSGKVILPTSKGTQLVKLVPVDLRSAELTAKWEQKLELISKGKYGEKPFLDTIREYTTKLVSAVVASSAAYKHDNITRERCPECGKYLLSVNGKKGAMLVCSDRECGYRRSVFIVSNARCPQCNKKLLLRGDGEQKFFSCVCGHSEKLSDFEARKANEVGKKEVERFMQEQHKQERSGGASLNSALSEQLAALKNKL